MAIVDLATLAASPTAPGVGLVTPQAGDMVFIDRGGQPGRADVAAFLGGGDGGGLVPDPAGQPNGLIPKISDGAYVLAEDLTTTPGTTNMPVMTSAPFSAVVNNTGAGGQNATAFGTNLTGGMTNGFAFVLPGTYTINPCNIYGTIFLLKGALLRPVGGNITFQPGSQIIAGHHQIFDLSGGGGVRGLLNVRGEKSAMWMPGNDLGIQLNNMVTAGANAILIPDVPGMTLTTPVTVRYSEQFYMPALQKISYGITVNCGRRKAAFQCVPDGSNGISDALRLNKNYEFRNLYLVGSTSNTPACAFWTSSGKLLTPRASDGTTDINGGKCRIVGCFADGSWGVAVWLNTSAEEMECDRCRFYRNNSGDYYNDGRARNFPRIGCVVLAPRNPNGELQHTLGSAFTCEARSNSAHTLTNADLWCKDTDPLSACIVLLGYIEDVFLDVTYGASDGCAEIVWDAWDGEGLFNWPRGITILYRGRNEGHVPFMLVDNHQNGGPALQNLHLLKVSHYNSDNRVIVGVTGTERLPGLIITDIWVNTGATTAVRPLISNCNTSKTQHDGQKITALRQAYSLCYPFTNGYNADNRSEYAIRTAW